MLVGRILGLSIASVIQFNATKNVNIDLNHLFKVIYEQNFLKEFPFENKYIDKIYL